MPMNSASDTTLKAMPRDGLDAPMGKTFKLTRKADTFIGTAEADTFTAPLTAKRKSTLGARDVLDGGKGVDAVITTLSGASLTSTLRGIETGTFTYGLLPLGENRDIVTYRNQHESPYSATNISHYADEVQGFDDFDIIDLIAMNLNGGVFVGSFMNDVLGINALSTTQTSAYFNTTSRILYIDTNHDGQLNGQADMAIRLPDTLFFAPENIVF